MGLRFLLVPFIILSKPVFAEEIVGDSLNEPLLISLAKFEDDLLLIRVSQDFADLQVELYCPLKKTKLSSYDFSSYLGLDELVLVDRSICIDGTVRIKAYEKIDQFSPYRVQIDRISADSDQVESLTAITTAGLFNSRAKPLRKSKRRSGLLKKVMSHLTRALSASDGTLRQHLLLLIVGSHFALNEKTDAKLILEQIISENENSVSTFKAIAYFELAPLVEGAELQAGYYKEGQRIGAELGDQRIEAKGANFRSIGLVKNGNISEGLRLIHRAYDLFESTRRWRDAFDPLHNLSWANQRAGNYGVAIEYAVKQKLLAESFQSDENVIWALYNLVLSYGQLGEVFVVEQLVDSAVSRIDQIPPERRVLEGYFLSEKVRHLVKFKKIKEADAYAEKMIAVFEEQQWPAQLNDARYQLAEVAYLKGELPRAKQLVTQVLAYDKANQRVGGIAKALIKLAEIELASDNLVESNNHIKEALVILTDLEDNVKLAKSLYQATNILMESGAIKEAARVSELSRGKIETYALDDDRARFALVNARIEKMQGNIEGALNELETAKAIVEAALPKIFREDLRQIYLALNKSIFELNIELLLGDTTENERVVDALVVADAFKARTLNERIKYAQEHRSAMSVDLDSRKSILARVTKLAATLQLADEKELEAAYLAAYKAGAELRNLEARLLSQRKGSIAVWGSQRPYLTNANLQVVSNREAEVTLSYFIGERKSWLWVVSKGGVVVEELPAKSNLEELIDEFLRRTSVRPMSREPGGHWNQFSAIKGLSEAILHPVEQHLNHGRTKNINVVPDGALYKVPFAALQLSNSLRPLVANFSISYAPALSNLATRTKDSNADISNRSRTALAVSNPHVSKRLAKHFPELPFSELEGASLQNHLGDRVTLMSGSNAKKNAVLAAVERDHSILHFAAHGVLNDVEPQLSGLIFSDDKLENAILIAPEISALEISAELVVLSACETSVGKSLEGEGFISLSRAFLEAGAEKVVGAQWRVQDQATSELFNEFYHFLLKENLSTAQSLRLAQLAVYNNENFDWIDPFFWAGFQVQSLH